MESDNLKTASLYINNQLLSRGLLRNGQTIEFARPAKGEGGFEGTIGRVMSVINDLILRRDRDALQRETLSQTIRSLRADSLRQTTDLERLTVKHTGAQRKIGISDSQERALKQQIKSAEQAARALKEEMGRMKILVGQTRAQCANEVRKRERTIEGLKRHVGEGGRARGGGKPVGVVTINVVPGVGGESAGGDMGVEDLAYDLRSETNEFLTELASGLSVENENMGALLRRTVETLQTLSGCQKDRIIQEGGMVVQMDNGYENLALEIEVVIEHLRNLLTNPSFVPLEEVEIREEEIIRLREGWERMESRWKDAVHMMDGWRKRMARSGQTVNLEELKMGLMLSPLKPKEVENTQAFQLSMVMEEGEGDDTQADINAMDDSELPPQEPEFDEDSEDSESSIFAEEPHDEGIAEDSLEQQPEEDYTLSTASSMFPDPPPQLSPLRETTGNRLTHANGSQTENFTTIVEENTYDLLQLDYASAQNAIKSEKSTPQPQHQKSPSSHLSILAEDEVSLLKTSATSHTSQRSRSSSPQKQDRSSSQNSSHRAATPNQRESGRSTPKLDGRATPKLRANRVSSQLPRPRENQLPQQSPLTMASIAAKLAATEREANAARVRAKIKAARAGRTSNPPTNTNNDSEATKLMPPPSRKEQTTEDELITNVNIEATSAAIEEGEGRQRKRKATGRTQGGRASRRRSTLSPWEMESLILGGIGASPGK